MGDSSLPHSWFQHNGTFQCQEKSRDIIAKQFVIELPAPLIFFRFLLWFKYFDNDGPRGEEGITMESSAASLYASSKFMRDWS